MGKRIKALSHHADKTYLRATGKWPKVRKASVRGIHPGSVARLPRSHNTPSKEKK